MRVISILAAVLVTAGVFCGGRTESAPTAGSAAKTAPVEAPAGFPAEAFDTLTRPELDRYAAVLPAADAAMKAAGFKPVESENQSMMQDMVASIEGMRSLPGVEDALGKDGMTWNEFRLTTFKVWSATAAATIGFVVALAGEMAAETEEGKAVLAKAQQAEEFFARVPERNRTLIVEYSDKLGLFGAAEEGE